MVESFEIETLRSKTQGDQIASVTRLKSFTFLAFGFCISLLGISILFLDQIPSATSISAVVFSVITLVGVIIDYFWVRAYLKAAQETSALYTPTVSYRRTAYTIFDSAVRLALSVFALVHSFVTYPRLTSWLLALHSDPTTWDEKFGNNSLSFVTTQLQWIYLGLIINLFLFIIYFANSSLVAHRCLPFVNRGMSHFLLFTVTVLVLVANIRRNRRLYGISATLLGVLVTVLLVLTAVSYRDSSNIRTQLAESRYCFDALKRVSYTDLNEYGCPVKFFRTADDTTWDTNCPTRQLGVVWEDERDVTNGEKQQHLACLNGACCNILGELFGETFLFLSSVALAATIIAAFVFLAAGELWKANWMDYNVKPRKTDLIWMGVSIAFVLAATGLTITDAIVPNRILNRPYVLDFGTLDFERVSPSSYSTVTSVDLGDQACYSIQDASSNLNLTDCGSSCYYYVRFLGENGRFSVSDQASLSGISVGDNSGKIQDFPSAKSQDGYLSLTGTPSGFQLAFKNNLYFCPNTPGQSSQIKIVASQKQSTLVLATTVGVKVTADNASVSAGGALGGGLGVDVTTGAGANLGIDVGGVSKVNGSLTKGLGGTVSIGGSSSTSTGGSAGSASVGGAKANSTNGTVATNTTNVSTTTIDTKTTKNVSTSGDKPSPTTSNTANVTISSTISPKGLGNATVKVDVGVAPNISGSAGVSTGASGSVKTTTGNATTTAGGVASNATTTTTTASKNISGVAGNGTVSVDVSVNIPKGTG